MLNLCYLNAQRERHGHGSHHVAPPSLCTLGTFVGVVWNMQTAAYTPELMDKLKAFKELVAKTPGWRDPFPEIPTYVLLLL